MKRIYITALILIGMMITLSIPAPVYSGQAVGWAPPTEKALVQDASRILSASDAEKIIKEYVVKHTPWDEDRIKVKNISIPNRVILSSEWDYQITPAPRAPMIGRTAFLLDIISAGKVAQSSWVSADIEIEVDVVLTSRSLKGRQVITEDDIYVGKKDLSDLPAGYIYDVKNIAGKRVKRFLSANTPLTEDILEDPPMFKRGDKVFIVAESETLKVTAMGVAGEDGYRGKQVKVTNLQSKKEVFADVVDGGTVSVRW
ncbi:MAG: flagellar basal body P-ring formation protein FlgA [Nitrospirae bacterium]|nr:flagellar basal body P-ring formation protein FlgA [Nitrospirota bacterium]